MKTNIILIVIAAVLLAACSSDETRAFIPGTYVNHAEGEYSVADDTLLIESSESNNYRIIRKTGFNQIRNKKQGRREYETEDWTAIYDEGTKTLTETRKGKLLTFYPESGRLFVGKKEYRKID
jgi:hypothetical protein